MTTRRSFLAAIAGALAIEPDQLIGPPIARFTEMIAQPQSRNPVIKGWADNWLQPWTITDSLEIQPDTETNTALFDGQSPANFVIHGIGWSVNPQTPLADLIKILNEIECQLVIGGKVYFAAPLCVMSPEPSVGPVTPRIVIAPRSDFKLQIAGSPLPLTAPAPLSFSLQGLVALT